MIDDLQDSVYQEYLLSVEDEFLWEARWCVKDCDGTFSFKMDDGNTLNLKCGATNILIFFKFVITVLCMIIYLV